MSEKDEKQFIPQRISKYEEICAEIFTLAFLFFSFFFFCIWNVLIV